VRGGGAFPGLDLAARLGLGARIGDGRQPVPWVHLDDAIALLRFAAANAAWMLRRMLGEMSELLTQGQRVAPIVALRAGFRFACPSLSAALRQLAKGTA